MQDVESRLRPEHTGRSQRVAQVLGHLDRLGEHPLRAVAIAQVDQRVREQDAETQGLDRRVRSFGFLERALQQGHRGIERPGLNVRPGEGLDG